MKQKKWRKWKIGAVATLGILLLFQEVRTSQTFKEAYAEQAPQSPPSVMDDANVPDTVMNDDDINSYFSDDNNSDSDSGGYDDRFNDNQGSDDAGSFGGGDVSSQSRHTRTERS
ncbi:hypothetical protein [Paenibacillus sp. OV219]|uniref:hypothetical protein n=1 Tax=Paenibacillus sp. OV219 TaxID=1884377 RepID=UPI0008C9E2B3|nr:hypothetical protein [Paenibacillus sp. OV219]SEO51182.1 hypothetical protein SAMN05518847_108124 [Paenibacillus sp. OV219]